MTDLHHARVWITGAGGLIGHQLALTAPEGAAGCQLAALTHEQLDLLDFQEVRRRFQRERPALILHCAALSRTQDCEANPALARNLNVQATALLAELATDARLVFFSSDLVFDGRTGHYGESAPVNPLSLYAETKVAAERLVLSHPRHLVVRTSINAGVSLGGRRAFNEEMRHAWEAGRTLSLFTDEFRSPIAAEVTARAVWELAARAQPGLYHVAGSERLSRWQIGQLLAARWPQLKPRLVPASLRDFVGPPRPPDTSLDCAKAQALLSFRLPGLTEWLAQHPQALF